MHQEREQTPFQPAPSNLRTIMAMQDMKVKAAWLKFFKKELKTLMESGTFSIEPMQAGDTCTPTMDDNRVKLQSDGSLDKLKTRIVVRGDLQTKSIVEDTYSPTASGRGLKMFLGHAARTQCRVRQLDFIGAYLQAKVRGRIFIKMPGIYGNIFPEFQAYCGVPVRLIKSMYRMTLSGKFWYQELQGWHLDNGYCLFIRLRGRLFLFRKE